MKTRFVAFQTGERRHKDAERRAAVTAFDAMPRPKNPPPLPANAARTRTAGELALAEDKRKGVIGKLMFRLEGSDE